MAMDALDVVLAIEQGYDPDVYTEDDIVDGLRQHKDTLRHLQGSWGRLIHQLEQDGVI